MSGFDRDWLALREPVDTRSRDKTLLQSATKVVAGTILDIGCGTGSTFRTLAPGIENSVRWRLLDNDPNLLDEVRRHHGGTVEIIQSDLNDIDALPLEDVDLVTASAFFDLCSEQFIRNFVTKVADANSNLYAALSYDGHMSWSRPHPLDETVAGCFNAHQLGDKGLGPSLGPKSWETLVDRLEAHGYDVTVSESPWLMTAADADLQALFLNGIVHAVLDQGDLDETEIGDWAKFRRRMVERDDSLCRVGHQDVLALRSRS